MLASYYTAVSFEFGISILRFMMVWLLLLLLLLLLCYDILGCISRQSQFFFQQWFNGSYKEENWKNGEILLVQQHFYYFEHGNFIIEGRVFFYLNRICFFFWMLLCFCHSFWGKPICLFSIQDSTVCARDTAWLVLNLKCWI